MLIFFLGCTSCNKENDKKTVKKTVNNDNYRHLNYIVLLDLSHRILQNGQTERDQALLQIIVQRFFSGIKMDILKTGSVNNDKLKIVIANHPKLKNLRDEFQLQLSIDNELIKYKYINEILDGKVEQAFIEKLNELYRTADKINRANAIDQVSIHEYFNNQVWKDLDNTGTVKNFLLVISDGNMRPVDLMPLESKNTFLQLAFLEFDQPSEHIKAQFSTWSSQVQLSGFMIFNKEPIEILEAQLKAFLKGQNLSTQKSEKTNMAQTDDVSPKNVQIIKKEKIGTQEKHSNYSYKNRNSNAKPQLKEDEVLLDENKKNEHSRPANGKTKAHTLSEPIGDGINEEKTEKKTIASNIPNKNTMPATLEDCFTQIANPAIGIEKKRDISLMALHFFEGNEVVVSLLNNDGVEIGGVLTIENYLQDAYLKGYKTRIVAHAKNASGKITKLSVMRE